MSFDSHDRPFTVHHGLAPEAVPEAAAEYWRAFSGKLGRLLAPEHKALRFLERVIDPAHAIIAAAPDGTLLGVAGYKTPAGAFVGGSMSELAAVYGRFGALWRGPLLDLLERDCEPGRLLMDGIFVRDAARGHGVGTALLEAVVQEAVRLGVGEVRLDVIDSNPRARALYEKMGFRATSTERLGLLRYVFGFGASTTMIRTVPAATAGAAVTPLQRPG